jgi:hypothetical protein
MIANQLGRRGAPSPDRSGPSADGSPRKTDPTPMGPGAMVRTGLSSGPALVLGLDTDSGRGRSSARPDHHRCRAGRGRQLNLAASPYPFAASPYPFAASPYPFAASPYPFGPSPPASVVARARNSIYRVAPRASTSGRDGISRAPELLSSESWTIGPVIAGPSDGSHPRIPGQIGPLAQIGPEVGGLSARILDDFF